MSDLQNVLSIAAGWHQAGEDVVLTTVTETWGSSPCPAGSRMTIGKNAFYIGAPGSRKTHATRLERLQAVGHESIALTRIHGPVGLNIAAVTALEIALSVIAVIVALRRGGDLAVLT
jgi:xanthine dehydrogenase accessory factor